MRIIAVYLAALIRAGFRHEPKANDNKNCPVGKSWNIFMVDSSVINKNFDQDSAKIFPAKLFCPKMIFSAEFGQK